VHGRDVLLDSLEIVNELIPPEQPEPEHNRKARKQRRTDTAWIASTVVCARAHLSMAINGLRRVPDDASSC